MKSQKLFTDKHRLQKDFHKKDLDDVEDDIPVQCYAIGQQGQIIKRFELIQASGRRYSFSYSLLPICIQEDSSLLFLKAYELLVKISGYNLDPIRAYLNCEQLLWAKENPSGKSDDSETPFIKEISIKGEAVLTTL
jgi:hypothetical protein